LGEYRKGGPDTVYLSRHRSAGGPRWALDGRYLPEDFVLTRLSEISAAEARGLLEGLATGEAAQDPLLPPVEPYQEVWASGVTYERSREAREHESADADAYARVYGAERPELFFKAHGWRAVGHGGGVRVRGDSRWNVPEPELVLVLNSGMEILGYTAGNDVSSRDIEGENPLYLPQAKVYDGSCSLGPGIVLAGPDGMRDLPIRLRIFRDGAVIFDGEVSTARMKRSFEELAEYLGRELTLPSGAFLMTGTGIVPDQEFTLTPGDRVEVSVGGLVLENDVAGHEIRREEIG
jgi:2-dehydro-3-deoxy-D-arabinonate dehydratase